jgi:putative ABC transport system permease protein
MQMFLRNLRFAVRVFWLNKGFTAAVVLTLALGIGANTAIFTVMDALLLRPFAFHEPERLVSVSTHDETQDRGINLTRYEMLRDHNSSFEGVAVWAGDTLNLSGNVAGGSEPTQVQVARVSANFFPLLGVTPQLGRTFSEEEARPEGKAVVMLSDALWRERFHADPNVIGQTIQLDSAASTVIGVLPRGIRFPIMDDPAVWTPRYFEFSLFPPARLRQGVGYLNIIARLRDRVTLKGANAELAVVNEQYRKQNGAMPDADKDIVFAAKSLRDEAVGDMRGKVLMLACAVGVVLLIACANVAGLMLSRAISRRGEMAVRTALGARRGTIVAQLLTESLLLALVAGVLGAGLGWAATRALAVWGGDELPDGFALTMDWRVLVFTLGVSALAGILFGIVPALQLARVDLNATLREEGRGSSAGRGRMRMKDALVVGQVALSLMLLIGAGLLMRSFVRLMRVETGFDAENVLTMGVSLSTQRYGDAGKQTAFFDEVLRKVRALPGVRDAAISAALPMAWMRMSPVLAKGQPDAPLAQRPFVDIEAVSPEWFETMRVPPIEGRAFTSEDAGARDMVGRVQSFGSGQTPAANNAGTSPQVVIVNEAFVRRFWSGQNPQPNPLTQTVLIGRIPEPAQVVGVAADVKNKGLAEDTQPEVYVPFAQLPWGKMNLLVRTAMRPEAMAESVRAQIAAVDADQPVTKVRTVTQLMSEQRAQPRFLLVVVGVFSGTALVLALIGIYSMLSYAVAERQKEFGIRMALGAGRADILRLVMRHGFVLALAGVGVGLIAAFALARLMGSMLYKTGEHDLVTFAAAPAVFLVVALVAAWMPARKATRVSPMETLR